MNLDNLKKMSKEKKEAIGYAGVIVIAVLAIGLIMTRTDNWPTSTFEALGFSREISEETKKIPQKSATQIKEENYTYEESLEVYEGLRIQIAECVARPFNVVYKNNTRVLLDGRSSEPQKITIGNQSVILGAFDSGFMTLRASELPAKLTINCQYLGQDHFNIATITLQQ